ncbi:MAG: preprotein translocase subunit SecG [Candidatus Pacebacteria bacterium]|nr:preprotein translocase subunit SecG [Candidatus Paceibacterota bacterium]
MITTLQIIFSIILIILVLIQERSSGLSGTFGGGESAFRGRRRGIEKIIFILTVVSLVCFVILSILNIVV